MPIIITGGSIFLESGRLVHGSQFMVYGLLCAVYCSLLWLCNFSIGLQNYTGYGIVDLGNKGTREFILDKILCKNFTKETLIKELIRS